MNTLRSKLVRLAYSKKELRPHLLPLLKAAKPWEVYSRADWQRDRMTPQFVNFVYQTLGRPAKNEKEAFDLWYDQYRFQRRASQARQVWDTDDADPWDVADEAGIHISRNKDFYTGWVSEDAFVAALFIGYDQECYSFDIAVAPAWQAKGLGTKLLEDAIDYYDEIVEAFPEMKFCIDAVNPNMVRMLKRKGFFVTEQRGGSTYLSRG